LEKKKLKQFELKVQKTALKCKACLSAVFFKYDKNSKEYKKTTKYNRPMSFGIFSSFTLRQLFGNVCFTSSDTSI
jgi:hypothetical protein